MEHRLRLRVIDKIMETDQAATLVLAAEKSVPYRAGQFLTFIFDNFGPVEVRRSYSLSSAPGVDEHLAVTVQQTPNGAASHYLVEQVEPGDELLALAPAGQLTLPGSPGRPRDIFLIGGGSGMTPLLSLLKYALHCEPASRLTLIDANNREETVLFREALQRLAGLHSDRFRAFMYLSDPHASPVNLCRDWHPLEVRRGRLSNALIEELALNNLHHDPDLAEFFLCGPPGLLIKAENALGYLGFAPEHIHRENYIIKPAFRPDAGRYPDSRIVLHDAMHTFEFPLRSGQTILEAAEAAGIALPYSCRSGSCATCAARCREGAVDMYTQDGRVNTSMTDGLVLTCVGYPLTEEVNVLMC